MSAANREPLGTSEDKALATAVEEFNGLATEYRGVIDRAEELGGRALLKAVQILLPQLYLGALCLPIPTRGGEKQPPVNVTEWKALHERLREVIGPECFYWMVFPDKGGEAIYGDLADGLADIYRDLEKGAELWRAGADALDVLWEWRFGFLIHWGAHLVEALEAIHYLLKDELEEQMKIW